MIWLYILGGLILDYLLVRYTTPPSVLNGEWVPEVEYEKLKRGIPRS